MKFPAMVFAVFLLLSSAAAAETLYLKSDITAGDHSLLNDLFIQPSTRLSGQMLPQSIDTRNAVTFLSQNSIASLLDDDLKGSLVGEGIWIFPAVDEENLSDNETGCEQYRIISDELLNKAESFSIPLEDWKGLLQDIREGKTIRQATYHSNRMLRLTMAALSVYSGTDGSTEKSSFRNIHISTNSLKSTPEKITVRAGTLINVLIYRQGIFITAPGRVNSTAVVGETTRVRLNGTGRLIDARITSQSSAEALF